MSSVQDIVELLDDDDDDDDCVLECVIQNNNKLNYDSIRDENPLLAEFMDKCLHLEKTLWMEKILNDKLLKNYVQADKNFKTSQEFQNFVKSAINTLNTESRHRFTLIQDLCKILTLGEIKKRVNFITLDRNIKGSKVSLKRKCESEIESSIQKNNVVLDSAEIKLSVQNDENCEKENHDLNSSQESNKDENKLLVPFKALECDTTEETCNEEKIRKIEARIASCKQMIEKLDTQEVLYDNMNSPYLKSERLKANLVLLYKELCKLSGEGPVKKREISLPVPDGHPAGPVRRLEKFLNKNIGSDGDPPFPNFRDVVKCVLISNEIDKLGWNNQQIMMEARVVFSHCGRELQRRRQNREWRDLLSKVKPEDYDGDPADSDPELLARLQANKRIALKKEAELLQRYAMMESLPRQKNSPVVNEVEDSDEDKSDYYIGSSSDEESTESHETSLSQEASTSKNNNENISNNDTSININDSVANCTKSFKVNRELLESSIMQQLEQLGDDYETIVEEIEDFDQLS